MTYILIPKNVKTAFYTRNNAPNVRWISKLMTTGPECLSNWHDTQTKNAYLLRLVDELQKFKGSLWKYKRHFVLQGHEKDWRHHFLMFGNTTSDQDVSKFKNLIGKSNFEKFVIYENILETNYLIIHGPSVDVATLNIRQFVCKK